MLNGAAYYVNLFCHDTSLIQVQSIFFGLFLYLFHKPKHLFKKKSAVEAAKSNHLCSHRVEIRLRKICSKRCRFTQNRLFCIVHHFWKKKCKLTKTITERRFSCQNKSVCQKLARFCKKWKSAQKPIYALFARGLSVDIAENFIAVLFQLM